MSSKTKRPESDSTWTFPSTKYKLIDGALFIVVGFFVYAVSLLPLTKFTGTDGSSVFALKGKLNLPVQVFQREDSDQKMILVNIRSEEEDLNDWFLLDPIVPSVVTINDQTIKECKNWFGSLYCNNDILLLPALSTIHSDVNKIPVVDGLSKFEGYEDWIIASSFWLATGTQNERVFQNIKPYDEKIENQLLTLIVKSDNFPGPDYALDARLAAAQSMSAICNVFSSEDTSQCELPITENISELFLIAPDRALPLFANDLARSDGIISEHYDDFFAKLLISKDASKYLKYFSKVSPEIRKDVAKYFGAQVSGESSSGISDKQIKEIDLLLQRELYGEAKEFVKEILAKKEEHIAENAR